MSTVNPKHGVRAGRRISFREPDPAIGLAVNDLIARCPPLDKNSAYCNLLQCSHFASTSVAAFDGDELVGFVSGYPVPERPDTLFIWQVAVAEAARGRGLGGSMLHAIMSREGNTDLRWLETTITESNKASWAMFEGFARRQNVFCNRRVMFDHERHFKRAHETELLLRMGPFDGLVSPS